MKKRWLIFCCLLYALVLQAQTYPFQDTSLPTSVRVRNLLERLTLDEKLSLMQHQNPAIERLGLKPYSWWNEALHGVGRNGTATVYPMPIGLAATWNVPLVKEVYNAIADEAVLKFNEAQRNDEHGDYKGLTFFTPNINIFRDPRWGRGMETFGEDPYLTGCMGAAAVQGLQHPVRYNRIATAACMKHFAVHSGPEGSRHSFDAKVSPRDLWTTYLPAFEYVNKHSYVMMVMCAYNRLNGEPCCTSEHLLNEILRHKWHHNGLIVTDCWALNDCWERDSVTPRHETHPDAVRAAADAFGGEVDLECGSGLAALRAAVDSGLISEKTIDQHVARILNARFAAGIDDPVGRVQTPMPPCDSLALLSATESLVLLKNNGILPLKHNTPIALMGPNLNDSLMPLGNYNGIPRHTYTIGEVLRQGKVKEDAKTVVYVCGISPQLEGEELPVDEEGFFKGDRTRIELPRRQVEDIKRLKAAGRRIVLVVCSGSAIALQEVIDDVDAVVMAFYGGEKMGLAVGRALYDKTTPWGRLPVTFYTSTSQLPPFEDYSMDNRTYRYMSLEPLFPFGYGLTYNTTRYDTVWVDWQRKLVEGDLVVTGNPAAEVVQLYASLDFDTKGPIKNLAGFVRLKGRYSARPQKVHFSIPIEMDMLRQFDETVGELVMPPKGTLIRLQVGSSSFPDDWPVFVRTIDE